MKYKIISILIIAFVFSCKNKTKDNNAKINIKDFNIELDNITNKDSLIIKSQQIIENTNKNKAEIASKIGFYFYNKSNLALANHFFFISGKIYIEKNDSVEYAKQIANIGVLNEVSGLYPDAIKNYLIALNIFKKHKMFLQTANIYNNIGIVYQQINKADKALMYYKKSLNILNRNYIDKIEEVKANKYNNIGTIYEESFKNYDSALYYYNKALKVFENKGIEKEKAITLNNIAYVYLLQKSYKQADSLLKLSLRLAKNINNHKITTQVYRNISKLYLLKENYVVAEKNIRKSIEIAQKINDKELEVECLSILYEIYEKTKNYEKANKVIKKYYKLKSQIAGTEQNLKTEGLNIKYQVNEKEHKIKVLELENTINNKKILQMWLFIGVLLFFSVGLFLFFRLKQKNSKLEILRMQRDISNYITQLEEIKEQVNQSKKSELEKIRDKIKQFGLTEREEDVLLLIAKGYKNSEIAEKLFLSINTIKTHTKNIFIKLDVENRIKAAKKIGNL